MTRNLLIIALGSIFLVPLILGHFQAQKRAHKVDTPHRSKQRALHGDSGAVRPGATRAGNEGAGRAGNGGGLRTGNSGVMRAGSLRAGNGEVMRAGNGGVVRAGNSGVARADNGGAVRRLVSGARVRNLRGAPARRMPRVGAYAGEARMPRKDTPYSSPSPSLGLYVGEDGHRKD